MISNENNQNDPSNFDAYHPDHVALFEAIYGKHLISLGGTSAIDNMFSDLDIRGLNALDLGFGLGGVAYYLAEKYNMHITGIDIYPWMVDYANKHKPANVSNQLAFNTYDANGKFPYQPARFDLVYSKGVLNHVANKAPLFQQVYSVLKENGLFVIADWIYPTETIDTTVPLVCETKSSYEKILTASGFRDLTFRDDSETFLTYAKQLLKNLTLHRERIIQTYNEALWQTLQRQHESLIEAIQSQQKIATRILAKK